MFDLNDEPIEIIVSADGKQVWVNSKDKCLVRVNDPTLIKIDVPDRRLVHTDVHGRYAAQFGDMYKSEGIDK